MTKRFYLDKTLTDAQKAEIKAAVTYFPNGSASYPRSEIVSFHRFDIDGIYGKPVGFVTRNGEKWIITVEMTPGASRAAFGFAEFSIGMKKVEV